MNLKEYHLVRQALVYCALSLLLRYLGLLRYSLVSLADNFLYVSQRIQNLEHRAGIECWARASVNYIVLSGKYRRGCSEASPLNPRPEARECLGLDYHNSTCRECNLH